MKHQKLLFVSALALCQVLITLSTGFAHHTGEHEVMLHTNNEWEDCAIVLDPSLTQSEFDAFIGEVSELQYFRPLAGAKPLGKFNFDITVEQRSAKIDDWEPKWNNTFSHPDHHHTLTGDDHVLSVPGLRGRMGITDRMDVELFLTFNPNSNYGFTGVAVKYALVNDPASKWGAAVRGSYMTLLGVDDMKLNQVAADFVVSRDIWYFRPYVGGAAALSHGVETTDKVDLSNVTEFSPMALIGTQFVWKYLSAGIEHSFGRLSTTSFKIGATF